MDTQTMQFDVDAINRLIGRFTDLQEAWERDPHGFDWSHLQALAREGAQAYNESTGPSFHALAIDGIAHTPFHERFLIESLQAGFDPFKLVPAGDDAPALPVIDHAGLAEEAHSNSSSARMHAELMDVARARFEPVVLEMQDKNVDPPAWLMEVAEACAESIPADLLAQIAPELSPPPGAMKKRRVNALEAYLSAAEMIVDNRNNTYG
jgi:hypothetical protein